VFYLAAVPVLLVGMWQALLVVPPEAKQLDSFRILYIHVPSAWMSLFVFALMALYAAIALVWRIKVCEILAMACAPMGAGFTLITLLTGSIWGKGTWGTWWDWDPRMTSELVLLFLYLGVIGLYHAIEDRRSAARGRPAGHRRRQPAAGDPLLGGLVGRPAPAPVDQRVR
jgi:heme exporter protein C